MATKRYEMTATRRGQPRTFGHIDMKNSAGTAELYFYGDIVDDELVAAYWGGSCPQEIADFVNGLDPNQPVTIYFNSGGGDVFAGLAIYNILTRHQGQKNGVVDGLCASIASVILMACDSRKIGTGAQLMVHDPWTWTEGNAAQLRSTADNLDQAAESILDVYMTAAADGVTRDQIADLMHNETWLRGEKAAEFFRVDTVDSPAVAAAASALFGSYKHLPAALTAEERAKEKQNQLRDELLGDLCLYGTH